MDNWLKFSTFLNILGFEMNTEQSSSVQFPPTCGTAGIRTIFLGWSSGWILAAAIFCLTNVVDAEQSGEFTYVDNGDTVTITDYPEGATGSVVIPATILDPVTMLDDPVTGIGFEAFRDCSQITSVSIPAGVKTIGNNAFYSCSSLANLSISAGVTEMTIGNYAFYNCISLSSASLPQGVTAIGSNAFFFCNGMASVTIPSSVTSIGVGAFYSCSKLTEVTIPASIKSIPSAAFYSCSGLTTVNIPSTVTSFGFEAFRYCSSLTSITLPPNLTSLGTRSFAYCRGLTSISIPASVITIGTEAFLICSSLDSISVDATNANYSSSPEGVLFNKSQSTLIAFPAGKGGGYSIPSSVTSFGSKAFFNCDKLIGVTFPSGLLSIGQQAFSTCSKLRYANFLGNAPSVSFGAFELAAPGFSVYYLSSSSGFTTPYWSPYNYPAVEMGANESPTSAWLLSKGFPANFSINSDLNGDGVSLLMARALNMDPFQNLSGEMPKPVFSGGQMDLSFYAGAAGISYVVEISCDMVHWSSEGVTLSAPDVDQMRTASADQSGPCLFMRLAASN